MGTRYRGRHRRPSEASRAAARFALGGAVVIAPLGLAGDAQAVAPTINWDPIIQCESGGNPRAENPGPSTASGLFQFLDSTWQSLGGSGSHAAHAPVTEQYRVAEKAYALSGLTPWNASKSCWAGKVGTSAHPAKPAPKPAPKAAPKHAPKHAPKAAPKHAHKTPATPAPKARHAAPKTSWAAAAAHGQAYTVRSGDTLSGIAAVHGRDWHDVYKANRRTVGADPDLIFPGERLQL